MENLCEQIEAANQEVNEERQKNVQLLQLLFPSEVAKKLWSGRLFQNDHYLKLFLLERMNGFWEKKYTY